MRYTATEQTTIQVHGFWDHTYQTTLRIGAICEHTGANAGFITAFMNSDFDQVSIKSLEVAQPYRRQGIARQLLKLMLTRLSGSRFRDKQVYIRVLPYQDDPESQEQLRALYTQYGFIGIGDNFMRLVRPALSSVLPTSVLTRKERAGLNYTLKHHANVYRALKDR